MLLATSLASGHPDTVSDADEMWAEWRRLLEDPDVDELAVPTLAATFGRCVRHTVTHLLAAGKDVWALREFAQLASSTT